MTLKSIILLVLARTQADDYWSEDFDTTRICDSPDEVRELGAKDPSQCSSVSIKNSTEEAFSTCKRNIRSKLETKCDYSKVKDPGKILFCKNRGVVTCCFTNETCQSWQSIQKSIYRNAKKYLLNKEKVLGSLVKNFGYKTCHALDSLDASKCAKDCENLKTKQFAKNCTESGGLFKCCIRRDKRSCHECRYCCTLPMCTYPPGGKENTKFEGDKEIKLQTQKYVTDAAELFYSKEHVYKNNDYYCLKPKSNKDPKKWRRYEMEAFRKASTSEELKKVKTFKYDNNLNNFVDPKVFKAITNRRKGKKIWKKSYGFHFTKQIPGYFSSKANETLDITACMNECAKFEKSKFGKKCRRDKGIVKCCVNYWRLGVYEDARNKLIKDRLIEDKPYKICKPKSKKDPCLYCSMNGFCTKVNPLTGAYLQVRQLNREKSKLDAATKDLSFKWCLVLDLCKIHQKDRVYYDKVKYQEVTNKKKICELAENGEGNFEPQNKLKADNICKRMTNSTNLVKCTEGGLKKIKDKIIKKEIKAINKSIKEEKTEKSKKGRKIEKGEKEKGETTVEKSFDSKEKTQQEKKKAVRIKNKIGRKS